MNESWTIAANGALRNLSVTVTYGAARGRTVSDTLTTSIKC